MSYEEALKIVGEQSSLKGKRLVGKEITNIIIAPYPVSEENVGEIASRIIRNKPFDDILDKHSDFTVIVIFQIELYMLTPVGGINF